MKLYNYYRLGLPDGNSITTGNDLKTFLQGLGFDIPLLQPFTLEMPVRPSTPYNPADDASRALWDAYTLQLRAYNAAQPAALAAYNQQFVDFAEYLQVVFVMARKAVTGRDSSGRNIIGWATGVQMNYTFLQAAKLLIQRFGTIEGDAAAIDFICNGQFG